MPGDAKALPTAKEGEEKEQAPTGWTEPTVAVTSGK